MSRQDAPFRPVAASLADLAGEAYIDAVCEARAALTGEDRGVLCGRARERVEFLPRAFVERLDALLPRVGERVSGGLAGSAAGASTRAFDAATHAEAAPLSGLGFYRVGEDGRLYLITKSEHYHAPLGHAFPGYRLLETARALGIANATHNNTRGHITRLLEEVLVRAAGTSQPPIAGESGFAGDATGMLRFAPHDGPRDAPISPVIGSQSAVTPPLAGEGLLDRVLNLETGSLAVEAALKMILARFYRSQDEAGPAPYAGRVPVLLVIGNDEGGLQANYHGTTVLAQTMRGMWPEMSAAMGGCGAVRTHAIRPNSTEDLRAAFAEYEKPPFKIAGLFHEIVMMNYGARVLTPEFLRQAYALCRAHDVPTVVDEIQSCLWAPELFLFREYGLEPTFVAIGKGFPGGEYPASRILFNSAIDNLAQFGALVTNGQEEIASLAYLVTMRWARDNADVTRRIGDYYEARLRELAARHQDRVAEVAGRRHMSALGFHDLAEAKAFAAALNQRGLDLSVQSYKSSCPPAVLTKLPLIATPRAVEFVVQEMWDALE